MKPILIAVLFVLAVLPAAAEGNEVVLANQEAVDFHYVLDPPELSAFDPSSSIFPSVVYDYFAGSANGSTEFQALPAGSSQRLSGLAEGPHLLVGFFVEPGRREFTVKVVRLQVGEGLAERTYSLYSRPAFASVRAGRGRLEDYPAIPPRLTEPVPQPKPASEPKPAPEPQAASEPVPAPGPKPAPEPQLTPEPQPAAPAPAAGFFRFRIDNRYDDWDAIPALAAFPDGYRPGSFTRERFGRPLEVLPVTEARHWGEGGTALSELKIVRDERAIYLYLATHHVIADNLSVFLYLQAPAARPRENRLTLELVPATSTAPGLVVLWEKDEEPFVVGRLTSGGFFLEAEVRNDVLLPYLESAPGLSYFDLTTCYFDRGALSYEEFYFGSPSFAEIPTPDSLF